MLLRFSPRARLAAALVVALCTTLALALSGAQGTIPQAHAAQPSQPYCATHSSFCTETTQPWNYQGQYTGHDEPSVLFYSNQPGSGDSSVYGLILPKDPPIPPKQDGTGGTANFQLHPAFWFGMAMCDNQSAPTPGAVCTPDSDTNIHSSTDPNSEHYIGKTPGTAFMEMQFYPPGWAPWPAGNSCDPTQWCAALNIDSFSQNENTGIYNNSACLSNAGVEYVNFAFITKSGKAQAPADPLDATLATYTPDPTQDLFMGSGDKLVVDLHDTPAGFQVVINDLTNHQSGSMTASVENQFGHPLYQPSASSCTDQLYAFHPMYSTSSEKTRVLWAAHSYNIAYSDEIGHFEYCNLADPTTGACTQAGVTDPGGTDGDDFGCFNFPPVNGCIATDGDFDGPEYQNNWPGTNKNVAQDQLYHASPVTFTSPVFKKANGKDPHSTSNRGDGNGGYANYQRVAFETDLPRVEGADVSPNNNCIRNPSSPDAGKGCVNPPNGASFYPIYSTGQAEGVCVWEEGGAYLPDTRHPGGTNSTEFYGSLIELAYPGVGGPTYLLEDFRQVLRNNPCRVGSGDGGDVAAPVV